MIYLVFNIRVAETDAVRDREYEGDLSVKKLSSKYRTDIVEFNKLSVIRLMLALRRLLWIACLAYDPFDLWRKWKFPSFTDLVSIAM